MTKILVAYLCRCLGGAETLAHNFFYTKIRFFASYKKSLVFRKALNGESPS